MIWYQRGITPAVVNNKNTAHKIGSARSSVFLPGVEQRRTTPSGDSVVEPRINEQLNMEPEGGQRPKYPPAIISYSTGLISPVKCARATRSLNRLQN